MKIIKQQIEMIAWFNRDGLPHPMKFRIEGSNKSRVVIKIDRIIKRDTEKLAGNKMIIFTCQSIINGVEKIYEIKYELDSCKWILFKI